MSQQKLQKCIQDCRQVMTDLQSLSNSSQGAALKSTLQESAHHLEMCVHECEFATKAAP